MWSGLLIEYHTARATVALRLVLAVGLKNQRRLILDNRQLYVYRRNWLLSACAYNTRQQENMRLTKSMRLIKSASRSNTREIDNACMFAIASEHACLRKRGVVTCNIHYVFFFLRFF